MASIARFQHAVVVGGSFAGLLTARVLSSHFEKVTVIEKDVPEGTLEPRKGVPQGRHVHVLLKSGERVLRDLFPGIMDELATRGSHVCDWGEGVRWFHHGVWKHNAFSNWSVSWQSRPLLEGVIRERIQEIDNIELLSGKKVVGLLSTTDGGRVLGVRYQCGGSTEPPMDALADLVIDCSGRQSNLISWLDELGFKKPKDTSIKIKLAYATRVYKEKKDPGFVALGVYPRIPDPKMGYIFRVENGLWYATLAGYMGDHPPTTNEGWEDFARQLPRPEFYNAIQQAEPLTDVSLFRYDGCRRYHFEKEHHQPEGLIGLGDCICSFDPVFGQGMSVAAKEVAALDQLLKKTRSLDGFYKAYYKKVAGVIELPWLLVSSEDFRFPGAEGHRFFGLEVLQWYVAHVFKLCETHPKVYRSFLEVMHLLKGPENLFKPHVLFPVLKRALMREGTAISAAKHVPVSSG